MARQYSTATSQKIGRALHKQKNGTLKSGGSGKTVTSKRQAIAIGLSEARKEGKKVPARKPARPTRTTNKRKTTTRSRS